MDKQKEFKGYVWPRDENDKTPVQRFTLMARTPSEAAALAKERFGEDTIISVWNEEEANTIR